MPPGYAHLAWTVLWQSTLANAVIATLAYWLRVPLNGNSFFMPFAALMQFAFIGVFALIVVSIVAFVSGFISPQVALWASLAVWAAIYFAFSGSNHPEMYELRKALGTATAFAYSAVAVVIWWRLLGPR